MSSGYINALAQYQSMQNSQNALNGIRNPQVFNPAQSIQNAMQTAALAKYLKSGTAGQATQPATTMRGVVIPGAFNQLYNPYASGTNAQGAGATATPGTASPAGGTAGSSTNAAGGFLAGGNNNYTTMSAMQNGLSAILRDPSNTGLQTAFSTMNNGGYSSALSAYHLQQLMAMTPDQRRSWALQQSTALQPMLDTLKPPTQPLQPQSYNALDPNAAGTSGYTG